MSASLSDGSVSPCTAKAGAGPRGMCGVRYCGAVRNAKCISGCGTRS